MFATMAQKKVPSSRANRAVLQGHPIRPWRSRMRVKLFRVIVPVTGIDAAARFYSQLLGMSGVRVSGGRHYFDCGGTILVCFDPRGDGDDWDAKPNPDHVYFAVDDLAACFARAKTAGCK